MSATSTATAAIDDNDKNDKTNGDIMTLSTYAEIIKETLVPHNPELQLCINDLVNPTESAETLLETLSNEQLNIIEQAVNKIKERKLNNKDQQVKTINTTPLSSTVTTLAPNSPIELSSTSAILEESPWNSTAKQVAEALADAISTNSAETLTIITNKSPISEPTEASLSTTNKFSTTQQKQKSTTSANTAKPPTAPSPFLSSHEPTTEIREGVEWVSFVYSHHRTLRRYCIRTDLDQVDTSILDDKFKRENCVYPRANLPRETYCGNRWAYETECNELGWKLAYLNLEEIAGKRGLIQRAVDSYRNRYPSMRSRRVARQEKLLKGTLRKRKHRDNENADGQPPQKSSKTSDNSAVDKAPKIILLDDGNTKCRIRINIESVVLDAIDITFRKNNCVFPRAMHITSETPCVTQRKLDEAKCNEIGWKLAWLNPRQLASKKNLLQRALDAYRNQFTTGLKPRKYASRVPLALYTPPSAQPTIEEQPESDKQEDKQPRKCIPLTVQALLEQQKEYDSLTKRNRRDSIQSCYSGTTITLDFHDYCFSPPPEEEELPPAPNQVQGEEDGNMATYDGNMFDNLILATLPINVDDVMSEGKSSHTSQNLSSYQNTPSPESLMTFYQQALLMNNTNNVDSKENNENTLFMMISSATGSDDVNSNTSPANIVDFIAKYQSVVNAGMGNFSTDPSLLNQLF